ncbi:hypothetical protein D5S17_09265 [Pseudonocardiaceae bacterium YIM PH 21723]|nr:hypothetical protein D5S17_09265 [Pseudonocardiaceae bacterium YIM PH 21723]
MLTTETHVLTFARQLAPELSVTDEQPWTVFPPEPGHRDNYCFLASAAGDVLRLQITNRPGREHQIVTIAGQLPRDLLLMVNGSEHPAQIDIDIIAVPARTARHLQRHVLPEYRNTLRQARADQNRAQQDIEHAEELAGHILQLLGPHAEPYRGGRTVRTDQVRVEANDDSMFGTVTARRDYSIEVTLRLTEEKGLSLIEYVRKVADQAN